MNAFPSRLFIMKLVPRLPTMIYFILTNLVTTFFQLYNKNLDLAHVHTGEIRRTILNINNRFKYFSGTRRHSQISSLSTAYTVKSLPGAMLYIPVENDYNTPVSLKRSLSDPEIYFPSSVRHSLIVAVNGITPHEKLLSSSSSSTSRADVTGGLHIDINVIQPTPNISPSHSLRSFSADSKDLEADMSGSVHENFSGIPFLIVPPSPVRVRRVSFSDTSLDTEEQELACSGSDLNPEINISEVDETVPAVRRSRCTRQSSLQVTAMAALSPVSHLPDSN